MWPKSPNLMKCCIILINSDAPQQEGTVPGWTSPSWWGFLSHLQVSYRLMPLASEELGHAQPDGSSSGLQTVCITEPKARLDQD